MAQHFSERFTARIEGISPLLQHRFTNMPTSTRHDPQEECEAALYTDGNGGIVQPSSHIESAMIKMAVNHKIPGQGKKTFKDAFRAGIFVQPLAIPHECLDWVIDLQPVLVNRARIMRARPRFDKWSLSFEIENIDERILPEILEDVLQEAGRYSGIGDCRPRYGRFDVVEFAKAS